MRFAHAIVRPPGETFVDGITTANLGLPDFDTALLQHAAYVNALESGGLTVRALDADNRFPDSTFVEDTAVLTERCAIITNPGAGSRNGEKAAMRRVIEAYFSAVETIRAPGTLDGGDVLQVDDHFFIGISERTNTEGAWQLNRILARYGYTASTIELDAMLHLKTGVSYLGEGRLVAIGDLQQHPDFRPFDIIPVDVSEAYAANCIRINDRVLLPAGFPKTRQALEDRGYRVVELEMSEFRKMDGGLSCLSIRF